MEGPIMNIKQVTTNEQLNAAFNIRAIVFIDEQNVPPDLERDAFDQTATHVIGYKENKPIATGRIRFIDNYGKLERIAVLKEHRGKSYGTQIITYMEKIILNNGYEKSLLNAQTHATNFYEKLGYHVISDEFMDAGIPHVTMEKRLTT